MAKNKNRKGAQQNRASQAEHGREQAQRSSTEAHESPAANIQGSPADVARKQKKSFGHN